jgi:nucleoside-diphosphate-sugar epimerase
VTTLSGARCLVTGAAGFIGSTLSERLLEEGCEVLGADCFTDYYPRAAKEANLAALRAAPGFRLVEADLARDPVAPLLAGVDVIFHQAAQPGVRGSWGDSFAVYDINNVTATQRLLEACRDRPRLRRLVFASSSSIYGDAERLPTDEDVVPLPVSPYGVTKLAAEHLCRVYALGFGVPAVALRYFTVFGPRQRPDMAFTRFCSAILGGRPITVNGDGRQTRDFTFVDDIVAANLSAAEADTELVRGRAYNLGGGQRTTVNDVIELLFEVAGRRVELIHAPALAGDARHTAADVRRAARELGFAPRVGLAEGLKRQLGWLATGRRSDPNAG